MLLSLGEDPTEEIEYLVEYIEYDQWGRYLSVAILTLIVYEYLITLGQEIQYVLEARKSFTTYLFLANRYWTLAGVFVTPFFLFWPFPPHTFCVQAINYVTASNLIIGVLAGACLIVRTNAFWNWNRKVLYLSITVCGVCVVGSVVALYMAFHGITPLYKTSRLPLGCVWYEDLTLWNTFVVFPSIVFECFVVALTILRAYQLGASTKTPIILHLFHTGLGYFFVMLLANMVSIFSYTWPTVLLPVVLHANLQTVVASLMCSRMLLALRQLSRTQREMGMPSASMSVALPRWSALDADEAGQEGDDVSLASQI